jgi:hypothetical protein
MMHLIFHVRFPTECTARSSPLSRIIARTAAVVAATTRVCHFHSSYGVAIDLLRRTRTVYFFDLASRYSTAPSLTKAEACATVA